MSYFNYNIIYENNNTLSPLRTEDMIDKLPLSAFGRHFKMNYSMDVFIYNISFYLEVKHVFICRMYVNE